VTSGWKSPFAAASVSEEIRMEAQVTSSLLSAVRQGSSSRS